MRKFYIIILLVVASIATSCKGDSEFDYTNAIPKDAAMVARVNIRTMLEKSGVGSSDEVKHHIQDAFSSGRSAQIQSLIGDILDDLDNSGLDLTAPIYLASYGDKAAQYMAVAKISDSEKFNSVLGALKDDGKCQGVVSHGDYSSAVVVDCGLEIAYNEYAAVIASDSADFKTMLSRPESESINSSKLFEKMGDMHYDVELMICWQPYIDALELDKLGDENIINSLIMSALDFNDVYSLAGLNFDIGAVSLYSELHSENDKTAQLFENLLAIHTPLNGRFNHFNDMSTSAMAVAGINGKELYSRIGDYIRIKGEKHGLKPKEIDILGNIIASFNGDLNIAQTSDNQIKAYAALTSAEQGRKIIESVQEQVGFDLGYENSAYMGIIADMFYFTTSRNEYQNIDEPYSPSMKDIEFKNTSDDNIIMCYMAESYLIKTLSAHTKTKELSEKIAATNQLNHIEFFVDKSGHAEINIVLKEKDINALRAICQSIEIPIN